MGKNGLLIIFSNGVEGREEEDQARPLQVSVSEDGFFTECVQVSGRMQTAAPNLLSACLMANGWPIAGEGRPLTVTLRLSALVIPPPPAENWRRQKRLHFPSHLG
jgi:hypothetical protein